MQHEVAFKSFPRDQTSGDFLWEMTKNYTTYLVRNNGVVLSRDPLNLTGINLKRDSGVAHKQALGINFSTVDRKIRERKAKRKARVLRFTLNVKSRRLLPRRRCLALPDKTVPRSNNLAYSSDNNVSVRTIVKTLRRSLAKYRPDLLPLAYRKLVRLHRFKRANKNQNKKDAKKTKV